MQKAGKNAEKMERIEKPAEQRTDIHLVLEPSCVSGNDVLSVEHLSKSFPSQPLFENVSFEIKRGEHVAVIGDNGTGKTTLLKILNRVLPADSGSFTLGTNVHIGYYDQEHHVLHMEKLYLKKFQMHILLLQTRKSAICWLLSSSRGMMFLSLSEI